MNDSLLKEDRDLTKIEYINLTTKINAGAIPVEYFRKNLFNASIRVSKDLKRAKTIYEDDKVLIKVTRSLHQKHRDAMSILFTDNKGIVEKPHKDGSYKIKTSLYHIAKEMGYKRPSSSTEIVKDLLFDLRHTEFVVFDKIKNIEHGGHRLIGEYEYDKNTEDYIVNIPSSTSKFNILNYSVEIDKKINKKILAIPNSLAKIKALISYMLSNLALKNGISFINICDKFDIIKENKSRFKKDIFDNIELLEKFNISVNTETMIIKYKKLEEVNFHRPIKEEEIIKLLEIENKTSKFIGRMLKHKGIDKEITVSKILKVTKDKYEEDSYFLELEAIDGTITDTKNPIAFDMLVSFEEAGYIFKEGD